MMWEQALSNRFSLSAVERHSSTCRADTGEQQSPINPSSDQSNDQSIN